MSDSNIYKDLTLLGGETNLPKNPDEAILERVPNPQKDVNYCVRFTAPEFTSLCPLTGQPDFAHLVICLLYTSPSTRDVEEYRMQSYA